MIGGTGTTGVTGEVMMTGGEEEDETITGEGAGAPSTAGEAAAAAEDTGGNATSVSPDWPSANIQYDLFLPQLKISNMHSLKFRMCFKS